MTNGLRCAPTLKPNCTLLEGNGPTLNASSKPIVIELPGALLPNAPRGETQAPQLVHGEIAAE